MATDFPAARSEQAKPLYRRLQRSQPTFWTEVAAATDLTPVLGRPAARGVSSTGFRVDRQSSRADRQHALSQLLHG
jgi:hypothetical protein